MKKYKDDSVRTRAVTRPLVRTTLSLIGILIAIIWIPIALMQYGSVLEKSSTAIGSTLRFNRSDADVTLQNIYTDEKKDVLIARLKLSEEAQSNLPFKGTDFRVLIGSHSLKDVKEVSVLFGKMSTDGDMFLVIPKPAMDDVYTIFLLNEKYVANSLKDKSQLSAKTTDVSDDAINKSLASTLSSFDVNMSKSKDAVTKVKSDALDAIVFRLSMTPGINNEKYKPTVLKVPLLNDETHQFDFKAFFDEVFKKTALEISQKEYNRLVSEKKLIENTLAEAKAKLNVNEFDEVATRRVNDSNEKISQIDDELTKLAKEVNYYENLKYDDKLFSNLETKATVFDVDRYLSEAKK